MILCELEENSVGVAQDRGPPPGLGGRLHNDSGPRLDSACEGGIDVLHHEVELERSRLVRVIVSAESMT